MELRWKLGHAGVPGNEIVNKNSKEASRRQDEMIERPYQDVFPYINDTTMKNGTESGMRKNANLKESNQEENNRCRKDETVINRLRAGRA